ncbi:echinoderm microtubule-associated protein-like CG42247 [Centruroides sculpturatus]|uniref:echinoderm microtubule-associated protein-like CG42247 n=1 Tax=Centruroides sculpturatus TaxID=218467 RepID=UPI000C6E66BE|nr:echinoderm microtubule-associated protein-like CG42247 [Centruroides sculpturatus]
MSKSQQSRTLEDKQYDHKIGFDEASKYMLGRKARMVTFYKNGDTWSSGSKISIQPGKDFKNLSNLCDYLTQKTNLPQGVRYIYTMDGKRIKDLKELEDGKSYVVSSTKHFQNLPYGQEKRLKTAAPVKNFAPIGYREDDLKLLRPVKPEDKIHSRGTPYRGSGSHSLPGEQDSRIIRIINNNEQGVQSRILLNLRTVQPFEKVVEDLGETVKLKHASRMLTSWQQEVRSFSQLKHELKDEDTFYLDNGKSGIDRNHSNSVNKHRKRRSNSAPRDIDWRNGGGSSNNYNYDYSRRDYK